MILANFKKPALVFPVIAIMLAACMFFAFPGQVFACGGGGGSKAVKEPVVEEVKVEIVYENNASGFTEKMYNKILGRESESSGAGFWEEGLANGSIKASDMVGEFVLGQEGSARFSEYSDPDFVDFLYKTLLNRGSDQAGYDGWLSALSGGASRADIVNGFTSSQEFADICAQYGINP